MAEAGRSQGGGGAGHPVPTPGMERRVDALPRAKRGELQGLHRHLWKTDPNHQRIPPTLHIGLFTILGGVPDMLLGTQSCIFRVPQRQHWPIPEPVHPAGC